MNEEPPERPWWARKLVGGPLSSGVRKGVQPSWEPGAQ
jgi:hypothetical protein